MTSSDQHIEYEKYFKSGHLNTEGEALAADAMGIDRMDELPDIIQVHLSDCQECRENVAELYHIQKQAGKTGDMEDHPFFSRSSPAYQGKPGFFLIMKYAAIAILIGLSSYIVYHSIAGPGNDPFSRWISGIWRDGQVDPFEEDPMIEPLVGMAFREDSFSVILPLPGDTLKAGESFTIEYQGKEKTVLQLELMDNQGKEVYRSEVSSGYHVAGKELLPGLYYWKISEGQKLLHLGKIYSASGAGDH